MGRGEKNIYWPSHVGTRRAAFLEGKSRTIGRGKAKSSYATRRVPTFSGDKFYIVSKYLAKWYRGVVNLPWPSIALILLEQWFDVAGR